MLESHLVSRSTVEKVMMNSVIKEEVVGGKDYEDDM